jgi:adenosine deaminase
MSFSEFWINNGKKEQLNDIKHGVRKEQIDPKHRALFEQYDINGDGTLEDNEVAEIFKGLSKFSGQDKILDEAENKKAASLFATQRNIEDADFQGFVQAVSEASEDIISSETTKGTDGGNIITTTYQNGMVETIYYYPDGEFKLKTQKQDSVTETTTYIYTDNGKDYKQCSQAELDKMIKDGYKKYRTAEQRNDSMRGTFEVGYENSFVKAHDVIPQTNRNEIHIDTTDLSDKARFEAEVRDFVVSHFVQTHKDCKEALDTMGFLDDIGAAINAGAGELWNACKNVYNKHFGNGTESDYQNFYELVKKFEPSYNKAIVAEDRLEDMRVHPVGYFTGEVASIDAEKGAKFQQTTEAYQNASILKSRIDILKKAQLEISMYENEQNSLTYAPAQSEGMNPASHILKANNLLLEYFNGDKEATNLLLNGAIGNSTATITAIQGLAEDTQKMFDSMFAHPVVQNLTTDLLSTFAPLSKLELNEENIGEVKGLLKQFTQDILNKTQENTGMSRDIADMLGNKLDNIISNITPNTDINKLSQEIRELIENNLSNTYKSSTFDEIKESYINQYKEIYNTDFIPEELTEKVMDAKATGGMAKMALITIVSILITRSPIVTQMMSAAAGGVEATGAAANLIRTLCSKYGTSVVQQGIKFALSTGTVATDVGLTLLNQLASEHGVNGEELWETAKGSAKYIYFGAFIGAPLAQAVSKQLGKIGATAKLFEGGAKTTQGFVQTTTITGDKLVQNFMKGGNKLLTTGGAFITDVAAFTALSLATEGGDFMDVLEEQGSTLSKLKIMNHFIEYMLGGKVHANMSKARMDAAIENSGVKNWEIKEIKTPRSDGKGFKTIYEVDAKDGLPPRRINDPNKLATAMIETITAKYQNTPLQNSKPSLDLTNLDEVQSASPSDVMKPTEATTFEKTEGITFRPNVNPNDAPSNAYKIQWGKTVKETIEINQKNGVPFELIKDESTGEYFLGVKHSWDNDYYRVDRNSIIVKYGEGDFAPVAEDNGAHIFTQTYLDAATGKPIDVSQMEAGKPLQIVKNPNSTVGAVAFDKPTTVTSLEGDMPGVEMARTDVDGHPYGTFAQLVKDIQRGKLVANEADPNSARFIELVKTGKETDAMALLKQVSSNTTISDSAPVTVQNLENALGLNGNYTKVPAKGLTEKLHDLAGKAFGANTTVYESNDGRYLMGIAFGRKGTVTEIKLVDVKTKKSATIDVADTANIGKVKAGLEQVRSNLGKENITETNSTQINPHNITPVATAEEVGAKAQEALSGNKHRIATAGYSAPPEGYEAATRDFLSALDAELGSSETAFITSPTADKGSIDAITTEVAGFGKGRLFYTTAQDYVEYINPENFPATIDKASYSTVPKFVLPDANSYSAATAQASNAFIATGGRNASVSDYVNAIKNGNKSIILDNTTLDVPAWGEAKGRVENASKYISEQIKAVREGRELPYPEVGEFTREFIEKNLSKIEDLTRTFQIDGTDTSVKTAAKNSAAFINGQEVTPQPTSKSVATQQVNVSATVTTELKELYNKKKLTPQEKARVEELEQEVQSHGILVARSPIIENSKISMLAKSEPREALLPDFNNAEQLRELGFTQEADGKWYHSNRDWYPNGLSENDVIYVFKRDIDGKPIDTGFGPKDELPSLYVRTEDFDANNMKFVSPNEMTPGQIISVKKCASGNFCILPAGTKLFTSEGIVEVKPGEIVNVKEGKNSVHTSNMTDITDMYKADPLNPASKKLFDLIEEYKSKESTLTETEKASFQARIADTFNRINRGQKLCKLSPDAAQNPPQTLRDEYDLAAKIAANLESKYLSRIDVSNFNTALSQAREVLTEIYADKSLTPEQQSAAVTAVMVKLLPKTNAHQHTKGSLPKETALQLAAQKGYTPEQLAELEAAYKAGEAGFATLNDFNNAYGTIGRLVNTPSDYKTAIDGIIRKAVEEGQLTTEIRCACDSLRDENGRYLSPEEGTKVILDAIEETKAQLRAEGKEVPATGYVFLTYRGKDWEPSLSAAATQAKQAVKTAMEHPDMKFGFDIAGPEDSGWGPKAFEESLNIIREYNEKVDKGEVPGQRIGITMHAGETPTFDGGRPGYLSVQEAIEMGADRIGHGVQAVLDEPTMQMMKDAGVTVEICGVCNIQSIPINTEGLPIHPIQQFIDKGIKVSLCTDNDAICGSNITKEYNQFLLTGHSSFMNWNNVKQSARDGIEAAFIPEAEKVEARQVLESRINQIQKLHDEVLGKAEAQAKLEDAARTNRPAPIVPSAEAVEAAKSEPTNAHVRVSETESRREETPTFANILMEGECKYKCFFCVENIINGVRKENGQSKIASGESNMNKHFSEWPNFKESIAKIKANGIKKISLSGVNTDPSEYTYLPELIEYLKSEGFTVGIRTNGNYNLAQQGSILEAMNGRVSYSVQSLNPATARKIAGRAAENIPDWATIIPASGDKVRVSIIVNRHNQAEVMDMIEYFSQFDNIQYIQLRKIYTQTDLQKRAYAKDTQAFEDLESSIKSQFEQVGEFKGAPGFKINGKEVYLWDMEENTISSNNYTIDGTFSEAYCVADGLSGKDKPTAFYESLSTEQKAIVDKYNIAHDDVVNIHGVLKIKLTKYDTPEIIESRFNTAVNGGSLRSADIPKATLETVVGIQRAKMTGVPRERKLYLITGRAGGGKSTIAGRLKLDKTTFMPDADELKPLLPGYKENGASYVHEASVALNTASIQEAFSKGINMTIQTTGWEAYIDEIVAQAKENGYEDIVLIHTDVTTENSIQRATSRAAATGRTVDPAFIESRTYIDEVVAKFSDPQKGIKEIIVYDNNGSAPVEVRRFNPTDANKAIRDNAAKQVEAKTKERKPAPVAPSGESIEASKAKPTNAHFEVAENYDSTKFYDNLSVEQKAVVDKYNIARNDIVNIHGALRLKLSKYDTPEVVESRFRVATLGKALKVNDIPDETLNEIEAIETAKKAGIPHDRTLYIITGRSGSGKTTLADQLGLGENCYRPNADEMKPFLPGYQQYGSEYVHKASVELNSKYVNEALDEGLNMVIEKIGWTPQIDEIIANARNNDYTNIKVYHVDTDINPSIERATTRGQTTGRTVDPANIEMMDYTNDMMTYYNSPDRGISEFVIYDNNGTKPVIKQRYDFK